MGSFNSNNHHNVLLSHLPSRFSSPNPLLLLLTFISLLFLQIDFCSCTNLKIYIYELPRQLNKHWSDVAFFSADQVTYEFARGGDWMFFAETFIHDRLMEHPCRTKSPEDADLFLVPVYTSVLMHHAHHDIASKNLKAAMNTVNQFPYFKRSMGQDHVFFFTYDLGACHLPEPLPFLRHVMMVTFLGDPAYQCYVPSKDIVIPPFAASTLRNGSAIESRKECQILLTSTSAASLDTTSREYKHLAYFRGVIYGYDDDCPIDKPPVKGRIGKDNCVGVHVRSKLFQRYSNEPSFFVSKSKVDYWQYLEEMKQSRFCLCPHGRASWTQRFFAAVHVGCIPVVIGAVDITYPFERWIDWSQIVVELTLDELPMLKEKLLEISPQRQSDMRIAALRASCSYLSYSESVTDGDAVAGLIAEMEVRRSNLVHLDRIQGRPGKFVGQVSAVKEHLVVVANSNSNSNSIPNDDSEEKAAKKPKEKSPKKSATKKVSEETESESSPWKRAKPEPANAVSGDNAWIATQKEALGFVRDVYLNNNNNNNNNNGGTGKSKRQLKAPEPTPPLDEETLVLFAAIKERFENVDCAKDRLLVIPYHDPTQGFGAQYQTTAFALAAALHTNRIPAEAAKMKWHGVGEECKGKKLSCFFEAAGISPCIWDGNVDDLASIDVQHVTMKGSGPRVMKMGLNYPADLMRKVTEKAPEVLAPLRAQWSISAWRPFEYFWFSTLELFMFNPLPLVLQPIAPQFQRLLAARSGGGHVLGMHVRRGDAFRISFRRTPSLKEYMEMAMILKKTRNVNTIVLATDDPITEAEAKASYSQHFNIITIDGLIRTGDISGASPIAQASQLQDWDRTLSSRITKEAIMEVFLLSETNYFIGTCFSQISRVAAELSFAKGLLQAAPVALDHSKCVNFPGHFYRVGPWAHTFTEK